MVITIFNNSLLLEFHIVLDYNLDNAETSSYGSRSHGVLYRLMIAPSSECDCNLYE